MQRDGDFVAAPVKHALDLFRPDKPAEGDEIPEGPIPDLCLAEPGEQAVLRANVRCRLAMVGWAPRPNGFPGRRKARAVAIASASARNTTTS